MEVSAKCITATKFEAIARGHRVICDQPVENGGGDEGMDPPEFLLTSLATCAAYYAAQYLKTRGLNPAGLTVKVSAEKKTPPAHLTSFRISVESPNSEPRHQLGIRRSVESCLIHNTLRIAPDIEIEIEAGVPALAC